MRDVVPTMKSFSDMAGMYLHTHTPHTRTHARTHHTRTHAQPETVAVADRRAVYAS